MTLLKKNIPLFHGTSLDSFVRNIELGFKPSACGKFGTCVYMTACSTYATETSIRNNHNSCDKK